MDLPGPADGSSANPSVALGRALSRWFGLAGATVGVLVLAGWTFHVVWLKSVFPGQVSMKPNTAVGLLLLGLSLRLVTVRKPGARRAGTTLALCAAAIGAATIAEFAVGRSLGIDQLLFKEGQNTVATITPGRMALPTAICFVLLGVALALIRSDRRTGAAQALASAAGLTALLEFVAVVYGARSGTRDAPFQLMAIHTSLTLILISCGVLFARSDRGFMAVATAEGPGSHFLRQVVPLASVAETIILGLASLAHGAGIFGHQFAFAMSVVTLLATLMVVTWLVAVPLNRRDAEQHAERARFLSVFESAADGILLVDREGGIGMSNPRAEAIFGYGPGEMEGLRVEELIPERFRGAHPAHRAHFLGGSLGESLSTEVTGLRKDGSEFDGDLALTRVSMPDGIMTTAIIRDTTESRESERALRASEEQYRTLTQQIPGVTLLDIEDPDAPDGFRLEFVGPQIFDLLGYTPQEWMSRHDLWLEVVHPDDRPRLVAQSQRALETGIPYAVEYRAFTRAGDLRWIHEESVRSGPPHDRRWHGLMRDITESMTAEAVRTERDAAVRAGELKNEFISRMSHELRTPLNGVIGFAQLLEMEDLDPSSREAVEHILGSGRHLLELVNDVLGISKLGDGGAPTEMGSVDVSEVVRAAVDTIRPAAAEREITVNMEEIPGLDVIADRRAFTQALLNLLSNAVKYNTEGGEIEIAVESLPAGRARIDVKDTGPGIPMLKIPRLFAPFDRLDAERTGVEGTGLGLALCKTLVEGMGGTVSVESAEGHGSTFSIELALA